MKTTSAALKIVKRTDRNTRGLAKVVSAAEYLMDLAGPLEAIEILNQAKFSIVQERRNLRTALWNELNKQSG